MSRLIKAAINPTVGSSYPAVTRATTSTRVNERGLLEVCANNSPRFDYDPVTKACKGLLHEASTTNVLLRSNELATSPWGGSGIVTVGQATGPDGLLSLAKLQCNGQGGSIGIAQAFTAAASRYTFSLYFLAGNKGSAHFGIQRDGAGWQAQTSRIISGPGTVSDSGGSPSFVSGLSATTPTRVAVTMNAALTAGSSNVYIYPGSTGEERGTYIFVGFAQLEQDTVCSSYVPTTSATVGRNADNVSFASLATSWFDGNEFSVLAEAMISYPFDSAKFPFVYGFDEGASVNDVGVHLDSTLACYQLVRASGGVTQASNNGGTVTLGQAFRSATAYKTNDFAHSFNGAGVVTDTSGTLPTLSRLFLGDGDQQFRGHLRRWQIYRGRLSNSDLQTLSGGGSITATPLLSFDFSGGALEAGSDVLTKARIGWDTKTRGLTATSVAVSTEAVDFPRDAPLRPETWEAWKPTAAPATWRVDLGSQKALDYVGILGSGANAQVEVSDDDTNWRWIAGGISLDLYESAATFIIFPRVTARFVRVTLDAIGMLFVVHAGPLLVMERHVTGDHQPLNLSRVTEQTTSMSDGGQLLGSTIRRMGYRAPIAFSSLTPAWWRANFDPFVKAGRLFGYFIAWNPADFPEDVAYAWHEEAPVPRYMAGIPLYATSWEVIGFDA